MNILIMKTDSHESKTYEGANSNVEQNIPLGCSS